MENTKTIIALGLLVVFLVWESLHPFHDFFRHRGKHRVFHGGINLALGLLNALIIAIAFTTLWLWASQHEFGLLKSISLPGWLAAIIAVVLFDFWTYWWHRFNHEIPFLWRFHSVHHADNEMDVTTANRFHFGEIILSSILRVPVILLIGAEFWHLALYEAIMFPVVQFHHANIAVPEKLDRLLRLVIPTPAMHKIHHSRVIHETNSNYTSLFSFWDRFFGSFRLRKDLEKVALGLNGRDDEKLPKLLRSPFTETKQPTSKGGM